MDKLGVSEQPQHVSNNIFTWRPFGLTSSYWVIEVKQYLSKAVRDGDRLGTPAAASIGSDIEAS